MADFNTHVFGAAAVISLGAICATKLLSLTLQEGVALMIMGVIGGVLPDVDLKSSRASQALFSVLGVFAGLAWLFASMKYFTGLELWLSTIAVFLMIRFPVAYAFHRLTTHRGVLHSLIAAVMVGVVACAITWQYSQTSALQSWLIGLSLTSGYIVHLVLDELYSVDFTGGRIKRSFGSAIKPLDLQQWPASCLVAGLTAVAWFWTAPYSEAINELTERYGDWQVLIVPTWL
ncbi:MAG: metal-dependent hydrolase [Granulosicoccus sp.]